MCIRDSTYGYNSGGETFTICDPNEAWIMEMMGKGAGSKGAVWVALRIPEDVYKRQTWRSVWLSPRRLLLWYWHCAAR